MQRNDVSKLVPNVLYHLLGRYRITDLLVCWSVVTES